MLDNNFDPYEALVTMDKNIKALIQAHNALAKHVEEQDATIQILIKGLDAANAANIKLMEQGLTQIVSQFSTGQH